MKKLGFILFFGVISSVAFSQTILWEEDFEDEANNAVTQNGASVGGSLGGTWSVSTTPSGGVASFSRQTYNYDLWFFGCFTAATVNIFQINNTGAASEGVWQSNVIDISALGDVALEIDLGVSGGSTADYVRSFYKINGGPEIQFGELVGGNDVRELANTQSAIISGNTVQIVVRGRESTAGNVYCGSPHVMGFDNIRLIDITTLYSIANGNWNNSNTWSYTGYGGTTCSPCLPSIDTKVFIGNNRTVNFNVEGEAAGVDIESTGRLQWTANNIDLNIRRGASLDIRSGGNLTLNGNAGAQIDFDEAYSNSITVASGGSLSIGDIDLNGATNLTISGGGAFTVNDDFLIGASNSTVTNNMTGILNILDQLNFETSGITFNNVGNMNVLGATGIVFNDDNNNLNNTSNLTATGATRSISFANGATGNSVSNSGNFSLSTIYFDDDNNNLTNTNSLSISGDIQAGANDNGCVITNSGTLSFSGINIGNADLTINNSGTINQSGNFTNNTIDTGSSFNNLSGGIWNWTLTPNTTFDTSLNTVLDCSATGNTFNYSGTGAQRIIPTQYNNLTLSNSGAKDANNASWSVSGNWLVSGTATFTEGTGTITMNGSTNQTITNGSGETFYNLTVNKTGGTTLNLSTSPSTNVTVTNALTLTSGIVNTTSSQLLTLNNNATSSSGTSTSYVDGPIRKIGNSPDPFIFPTGDGAIWARIGVDYISGSSASTQFTAQYFDAAYPDLSNDGSFNNVSGKEYWILNQAVTTATARVQLYWQSGSRSQINSVSTDLIVAKYTSPDWVSFGQSTRSGNTTAGTVTSNNISSFSPFTFGSLSSPLNPLPVELTSFNARVINDKVDLTWITASELNNDLFTIERSSDAESFEEILTLKGNGTTNEENVYSTTDPKPIIGRSYYRLKQRDFDGTTTYSDLVSVEYEGPAFATLHTYPNPSLGTSVTLELKGVKKVMDVPVIMVSMQGEIVFEGILHVDETGIATQEVEFQQKLASGLYVVKAGPSVFLTQKVAVIR